MRIRPDTPRRVRIAGVVLELTEVLREEPFGFELRVRDLMSRFFLLLLEETEEVRAKEKKGNERDMERMRLMLPFIYAHYGEAIGLPEIAGAAGVSPRECTRCFQRSIGRPPVRFLIEYRADGRNDAQPHR